MKFIADSMLGRLARWLRLSGYDVTYANDILDEGMLEHAKSEGRILLSKDKNLCKKAKSRGIETTLIMSEDILEQLKQVATEKRLTIRSTPELSRCPLCNAAVEKIEKQFRRYRDRLKHHQPRPGTRVKIKFNVFSEPQPQHDSHIIESKEVEARPMMLDEACMQMDLLGSEILVFMNAKSDRMNVLYRKKGQKYGLIEAL